VSARQVSVAIQGEPGSNSALAAEQRFGAGHIALVPCRSFADLFSAVTRGAADFGVAPVENSLGGAVHLVWEQLARTECRIMGELYFHVRHCLIAHPSVALQEIRCVYSHPQALAQCQRYLRKLVWLDPESIVEAYDTAGAVKMVRARGRREEAAIASPRAAEIYDMRILATDIQTDPHNHTRFLVFAAQDAVAPPAGTPVKTTLMLTVRDCGTALTAVVSTLREAGLEMLKLETVKQVGQPWQYLLYVDCRSDAAGINSVLPSLSRSTVDLRVVGTYPLAEPPA
jgi:prephenate dehydratase